MDESSQIGPLFDQVTGAAASFTGDGLRSRTNERRVTTADVAVHALNRMLEPGRPTCVRVA